MSLGRELELTLLQELWRENRFIFTVIYGSKHVGKTTLIHEFCRGKKTIFFSSLNSTKNVNLASFSNALFSSISPSLSVHPTLTELSSILNNLNTYAQNKKIVVVFDNFQYLLSSIPDCLETFQYFMEQFFLNTNLFLVFIGSPSSLMEQKVLGEKSPLYGLCTESLKLSPFSYKETGFFFSSYSHAQKALVYGVTGGIPYYFSFFSQEKEIHKNILSAFFQYNSPLLEMPAYCLNQEFSDLKLYNGILTNMAAGKKMLQELSEAVHLEPELLLKYLKNLSTLEIIQKRVPLLSNDNKNNFYEINNYMFYFWYRFVPFHMSYITSGRMPFFYQRFVEDRLDSYMEQVFTKICTDYLSLYCPFLPMEIAQIGSWWDQSPLFGDSLYIPIVAVDPEENQALFASASYSSLMDVEDYIKIKKASLHFTSMKARYYYLFSCKGFTKQLQHLAAKENVFLFLLPDLYA